MTLKKHAKFCRDRTLGGAITVKKLLKPYVSYGKLPVLAVMVFFIYDYIMLISFVRSDHSKQLCLQKTLLSIKLSKIFLTT